MPDKPRTQIQLAVQLYEYRWNRMGRKGRICRVLARGKMNSCLVEFTDGFKAITSRNAIKKLGVSDAG
jgi:hypothetical protein